MPDDESLSLAGAATSLFEDAVAVGAAVDDEVDGALDVELLEEVDVLDELVEEADVVSSLVGATGSVEDVPDRVVSDADGMVGVVDRVNVGVEVGAVVGSVVDEVDGVAVVDGVDRVLHAGTGYEPSGPKALLAYTAPPVPGIVSVREAVSPAATVKLDGLTRPAADVTVTVSSSLVGLLTMSGTDAVLVPVQLRV